MSAIIAFVVTLGLVFAALLIWPQCPKCRKWAIVWNRGMEKDGKPWAVCSICGHEWNPIEEPK